MAHRPKKPDPAAAPLTDQEEAFVNEYMRDLAPVRAYQAVFPGTSARGAKEAAAAMRALPHVAAEIAARKTDAKIRCAIRADNVLREWGRIAFSDVSQFYGPDGRLIALNNAPMDARRCVQSLRVRRERTTTRTTTVRRGRTTVTTDVTVHEQEIEIKLYDKLAALQRLGAFLGLADSLPDLERLLAALPPHLANQVRAMLEVATSGPQQAKALPGG